MKTREQKIRRAWEVYNSDYEKRMWLGEFCTTKQFKESRQVVLPFEQDWTEGPQTTFDQPVLKEYATYRFERRRVDDCWLWKCTSEGIVLEEWTIYAPKD